MMRVLGTALAALLAACSAQAPMRVATQPAGPRAVLEADAAAILGLAVVAEVHTAPAAILVRMPEQFPQRTNRPPSVAAAVRTPQGWLRIALGGARTPFDRSASLHLDSLLANPTLWTEPPTPDAMCTDPSGIVMLVRSGPSEKVATYPCGFSGLTGEAGEIVLGGGIRDWTKVPVALRPPGIPLRRLRDLDAYRFMNGIYDQRRIEIRSEDEWRGQWMRIQRSRTPPPLPTVDFSREMLLLAGMGNQPSGGYVVTIERVLDQPDALVAYVRHTVPGPRCGAIAAITSPIDVVVVAATRKPVRWVVERTVNDCA